MCDSGGRVRFNFFHHRRPWRVECTGSLRSLPFPSRPFPSSIHIPHMHMVQATHLSTRFENTHRGARTHDHKVKSLALYRLSKAGLENIRYIRSLGLVDDIKISSLVRTSDYCVLYSHASSISKTTFPHTHRIRSPDTRAVYLHPPGTSDACTGHKKSTHS